MELGGILFLNPVFLKLLVVPAFLLVTWLYRFWTRHKDVARYSKNRIVPLKERFLIGGRMFSWLCLIFTLVLSVTAMARPRYLISAVQDSAIDLIVILDGSASSRVTDIDPSRWQRSIGSLKTLVQTMRWDDDRLALATFARRASPFIRITSDPNVVMFFLDHLDKEPPIPLDDNTAWDTNIEEAIYWGLRLVEKDKEFYGDSGNPKAFILISDGQAWSGEVENSIAEAVSAGIPIHVIGVGTDIGGFIPSPPLSTQGYYDQSLGYWVDPEPQEEYVPIHSAIDRVSLRRIANAGRGRYFELNRGPDSEIAASIISMTRLQSVNRKRTEDWRELYWELMCGAVFFIGLSVVFLFKQ